MIAAVLAATPDRVLLAPGPDRGARGGPWRRRPAAAPSGSWSSGEVRDTLLAGRAGARRGARRAGGGPAGTGGRRGHRAGRRRWSWRAHVDAATGALLGHGPLAARAHDVGALAACWMLRWSAGAVPLDAPGTGADIVLVDGHRWLLGPEGVTAAWVGERVDVRARRLAARPACPGRRSWDSPAASAGCSCTSACRGHSSGPSGSTGRLHGALSAIDGVEVLSPVRGLATTVAFRIAGWPVDEAAAELGRRCFAVLDVDERRGLLRAGVGAWLRDEELDRFAAAVADLARHSPETLPRRPMLTLLGDEAEDRAAMTDDRPARSAPGAAQRSWVDVRVRQARNPPPPVFRAVVANLVVATVGAVILLAYDWLAARDPSLPDIGAALTAIYVVVVLVVGSVLTYLWVELPTGAAGGEKRRSPWAALLGFFAAVPIVYLVLVVAMQIVRPAAGLGARGQGPDPV